MADFAILEEEQGADKLLFKGIESQIGRTVGPHMRHGKKGEEVQQMSENQGKPYRKLALAVAIGLCGTTGIAQAAATDISPAGNPTAGSTYQESKDKADRGGVSLGNVDIEVKEADRPELKLPESLKVQVNDFKVTGQDLYPESTLTALIADQKGKLLSFSDLQANADRITKYMRDRGYLTARAYLPVQKITNGVVEYAVVIGRFEGITVNNHTKIHDSAVNREISFLKKGDYIRKQELERAVWLLSDLAGADAKATLSPGTQAGTVQIVLDLKPHQGKQGLLTLDNYGNRYTGYNEVNRDYDFLNLAREGDHLAVSVSTTGKKLHNGSATYTIPVIRDGMTMSLGYSQLGYELGDIYDSLGAYGTARVGSIGLDYAVQRSQRHNLYTGIRYEYSKMKDEYRDLPAYGTYSDKTGKAAILSVYGNEQDRKGATNWRVDYKFGNIGFNNDRTREVYGDSDTEGTYSKLKFTVLRRQDINQRLYALYSLRGQYAFNNLDSSEHFALGGISGVRAYPQSESSGDMGYLTRAELRWMFPVGKTDQMFQIATYFDHGGSWINRNNNSGTNNHRSLQGVGLGLIWSRHEDWFVRMDYAWRLGSEEPKADTSHMNGHFWIQGGVYF